MYSLLHYIHLNYSTMNLRVRSVFTSIFAWYYKFKVSSYKERRDFEMIKMYINFSYFLIGANRLNELFIKEELK